MQIEEKLVNDLKHSEQGLPSFAQRRILYWRFISLHCIGLHCIVLYCIVLYCITVKILKIGTPEIITIIVLQLEQLDFTVQYCVQKMQTE